MRCTGPKLGLNLRTMATAHIMLYRTWRSEWLIHWITWAGQLWQVVVHRITVIEFGVNDGGGDGKAVVESVVKCQTMYITWEDIVWRFLSKYTDWMSENSFLVNEWYHTGTVCLNAVTAPSTNARTGLTSTGPIWAIKALLLSSSIYKYKYT